MTQQGMISDADGDIAALVYAAGDRPDAIRVASETRTPLIIAVPAFEFERWTRCSHGMTVRLDCALDPVLEWWQRVSARNPRMLASGLRACEHLK